MIANLALRQWAIIHKWTSLVCAVFLLVFCVTGLPLVFHEELDDLLSEKQAYAVLPADAPMANLDGILRSVRERHPDQTIASLFVDDDEPKVVVALQPSPKADPTLTRWSRFDARTGELLKEIEPVGQQPMSFLTLMLRLHRDLFAGLPGELFLGTMGFVFAVSVISGVVLYAPFAGRQRFGTIRAGRSPRLKWLDLHNLLGVVTVAWALVVGLTGVMNELSRPLAMLWQATDVQAMFERYRDQPTPRSDELSSVQDAFDTVKRAVPGQAVTGVLFPGGRFGSPYHYLVWTKGNSTLTSRLFSPVLVDARTGELSAMVRMPWYLQALQVSRPLHFGDYGGLPLKIIWAVLDLVTILVLGSGVYLWLSRRHSPVEARLAELGSDALDRAL